MFKILSTKEYEELTKNKNVDSDKLHEFEIAALKISHERKIEEMTRTSKLEKEDNEIAMRRKDADLDIKIQEAGKVDKAEIARLTLENGNLKKETEILTKAFENMGFDVKDMKEILNKLVDGIVSKNTVQLVK